MNSNKMLGYFYIVIGLFVAIALAGQLLFQILGALCGFIVAFHGWRLVRPSHRSFYSAQSFFFDKFQR